jgi:uncharacterized protein GlcG (DUF336 family)
MVALRKSRFGLRSAAVAVLAAALLVLAPSTSREAEASHDSGLSRSEIQLIIRQAVEKAETTASGNGFRSNTDPSRGPVITRATKMHIAVVARDGRLLALHSMPDAWVGSVDIAIAKARTAAFFSSRENALTSRVIGVASWPHQPDGTGQPGPLWGIGNSNQIGITGGSQTRNGLITFPGGVPLYVGNTLVGGIGVSGDAVDQDEAVAFAGAEGFEPGSLVVRLGFALPTVPPFPPAP